MRFGSPTPCSQRAMDNECRSGAVRPGRRHRMPTERTVSGPEKDWLTREECAIALGITSKALDKMHRTGKFPPPIEVINGRPMWHWFDVVAYMHLLSRGVRWSVDAVKALADDETETG